MNNHRRAPARNVESLENRILFSVVTVAPIDVTAGNAPTAAVFTATLDTPSATPIQLSYATVDGTAHAGRDYRSKASSLIIPAGASSAIFTVPVLADTATGPNLSFGVKLKVTPGNTVTRNATATIIENSVPPTVSVTDAVVNKAGNHQYTTANILVTLSNASAQKVYVGYQTENGTAVGGQNYVATGGTLTFKRFQTTAHIKVTIIGTLAPTPDQLFSVALTSANGATVPAGLFSRVVIRDVNPHAGIVRPNLTVSSPTVVRGEDEDFDFTLSAPSKYDVTARYSTVAATANTSQFTPESGFITIPAGQTSTELIVPTVQNTDVNVDTNFRLALSALANAQLATPDPIATILAYPGIIASGAQVDEDFTTPTIPAVFTVVLNDPSPIPVSVTYNTADGTIDPTVSNPAVANADYAPTSGTITFAPGQTRATVSVPIIADVNAVDSMTFFLTLSGAVNGVIANGTATGVILDDPTAVGPPAISVGEVDTEVLNGVDMPETFVVSLSETSASTVTVNYATADGTAVNGVDYTGVSGTLTFAPGQTEQDVNVAIAGSSPVTVDKTFTFALSNPTNATLAVENSTASSTITELGTGITSTNEDTFDDVADNLAHASNGSQTATVTTFLAGAFNIGDNGSATLDSVNLLIDNATGIDANVALYSGQMHPTTLVANLTSPATFSSTPAPATFTPQGVVTLQSGTRYWLVLSATSGGAFEWATASDNTGSENGFESLAATTVNSASTWTTRTVAPFEFNVIVTPAD